MSLKEGLRQDLIQSNAEIVTAELSTPNPVSLINNLVQSNRWVLTQANNGTAVTVELTGPGLQAPLVEYGYAPNLKSSRVAAMQALLQKPEVQDALRKHKKLCTYASGYRPSPQMEAPFTIISSQSAYVNGLGVVDAKYELDNLIAKASRHAGSPDLFKADYQITVDGPPHLPKFTAAATFTLTNNVTVTGKGQARQKKDAMKKAAAEILSDPIVQRLKMQIEGYPVVSSPVTPHTNNKVQQSASTSSSTSTSPQLPGRQPGQQAAVLSTATSNGAQQAAQQTAPMDVNVMQYNVAAQQTTQNAPAAMNGINGAAAQSMIQNAGVIPAHQAVVMAPTSGNTIGVQNGVTTVPAASHANGVVNATMAGQGNAGAAVNIPTHVFNTQLPPAIAPAAGDPNTVQDAAATDLAASDAHGSGYAATVVAKHAGAPVITPADVKNVLLAAATATPVTVEDLLNALKFVPGSAGAPVNVPSIANNVQQAAATGIANGPINGNGVVNATGTMTGNAEAPVIAPQVTNNVQQAATTGIAAVPTYANGVLNTAISAPGNAADAPPVTNNAQLVAASEPTAADGMQHPAVIQEAMAASVAAEHSPTGPVVIVEHAHPTLVSMLNEACQIKHWRMEFKSEPPKGPSHRPILAVQGTLQGPEGLPPEGIVVRATAGSIKQAKPIAAALLLQHPAVKQELEHLPKFKELLYAPQQQ